MKTMNEYGVAWKIISDFSDRSFDFGDDNNYTFEIVFDGSTFFFEYTIKADVYHIFEETREDQREVDCDFVCIDFTVHNEDGDELILDRDDTLGYINRSINAN